ncbi:MAG: hypothetical protein ACOC4G_12875 [Bacillota bacterium]
MSGRNSGGGRGRRQGNKAGAGPSGKCICPECGTEVSHERGMPCYKRECPECGTYMRRK